MKTFFIPDAWAQVDGSVGSGFIGFLPMVAIIVIFYFLLIRPQQKRAKEHKEMVRGLSKGNEVITNGGTLGKIIEVDENFLTLEISAGVNIKVQRISIAQMVPNGTIKG